jgi:DnaJ-domain-containing protein 1
MKPVSQIEIAALLESLSEFPKHRQVVHRIAFQLDKYKSALQMIAFHHEDDEQPSASVARKALEYKD